MVRHARTLLLTIAISMLLVPLAAFADEEVPEGMTAEKYAELQHAASLDTEDLYDGQEVTKEEFAANLAALDVAMKAAVQRKAAIVYPEEEDE